jgi:HPt (histidine-containing phosphotransfer) domain-containing protein
MFDEPTPEASLSKAAPRLNANSLSALRALDPNGGSSFVRRVLETYLRSLDKHIDSWRNAEAAGDLAGLRAVAHTLKSSSSSVGALTFAARSAEVEAVLRQRLEHPEPGVQPLVGLAPALAGYLDEALQVRSAVVTELGGGAA